MTYFVLSSSSILSKLSALTSNEYGIEKSFIKKSKINLNDGVNIKFYLKETKTIVSFFSGYSW